MTKEVPEIEKIRFLKLEEWEKRKVKIITNPLEFDFKNYHYVSRWKFNRFVECLKETWMSCICCENKNPTKVKTLIQVYDFKFKQVCFLFLNFYNTQFLKKVFLEDKFFNNDFILTRGNEWVLKIEHKRYSSLSSRDREIIEWKNYMSLKMAKFKLQATKEKLQEVFSESWDNFFFTQNHLNKLKEDKYKETYMQKSEKVLTEEEQEFLTLKL